MKKNYFSFCVFTLYLGCFTYISGISFLLTSLIFFTLLYLGFYAMHIFFSFFIGVRKTIQQCFLKYVFVSSIVLLFLFGGSTLFVLNQNYLHPAVLPYYVLSNGEKTLRFQTMSHIATPEFYEKVKDNIIKSKQEDYVLFYEGVQPGHDENMQKFYQLIGFELNGEMYKGLAKLFDLSAQPQNKFLGLVNDKDFNVDLNIDEMMNHYEGKIQVPPILVENLDKKIEDAQKQVLESMNPKEQWLFFEISQALFNFTMKQIPMQSFERTKESELMNILLESRNKTIAEKIISSSYDKIHLTYGLLHFEGIYHLLKAQDTRWEIIEKKDYIPIEKT